MEFGELNCVQGRRNGYKMDHASKMLFMRMVILLVSLMMMLILHYIDPKSHDFCLSDRYLCLLCAPSRTSHKRNAIFLLSHGSCIIRIPLQNLSN